MNFTLRHNGVTVVKRHLPAQQLQVEVVKDEMFEVEQLIVKLRSEMSAEDVARIKVE